MINIFQQQKNVWVDFIRHEEKINAWKREADK